MMHVMIKLVVDPSIAGISGDMLLGAFIGLGFKPEKIIEIANVVEKIVPWVKRVRTRVEEVRRSEFKAWRVDVLVDEEGRCRRGSELLNLVEKVATTIGLNSKVFKIAYEAAKILVEVEAEVHGEDISRVNLCEISSADTIVDIVGVAYALQELGLVDAKVYGLPIAVGGGRVHFSHGVISAPAPVVLEIAKKRGLTLVGGPVEEELATPTGIAIYASIVQQVVPFYPMIKVLNVGYGAGSKELPGIPNILRLVVGEIFSEYVEDNVFMLETDIDDLPGEILGFVGEKLIAQGALDISFIPKIGKKGRPSVILRVLTKPEDVGRFVDIMVRETGTLGVRVSRIGRYIVPLRDYVVTSINVNGKRYDVRVKVSRLSSGEVISTKPEFEDLKRIAMETGIPLRELMRKIIKVIDGEH